MPEIHDVSVGRRYIVAVWTMVAVSGVFISLKILARARRRMRLWWDDYLMVMSWVCVVAASAFLTAAIPHGLGRHARFLDPEGLSEVLRLSYLAAVLTIIASVWSKVSFALFLLRISSSGCTEWTRRAILGIIISLNVMLAAVVTVIVISCRPMEKTWKPEIEGTCFDDNVKVYSTMALAGSCLLFGFGTMSGPFLFSYFFCPR